MPSKPRSSDPVFVCFDARMIANSGIGTQIYNVLKIFSKKEEQKELFDIPNPTVGGTGYKQTPQNGGSRRVYALLRGETLFNQKTA